MPGFLSQAFQQRVQSTASASLADANLRAASISQRNQRSYSDEVITPESALTVPAVLAAITIIAEDTASLPLILYKRNGKYKNRAFDNIYYRLMHDQPNPEHTSFIFRELLMGHLLAWGNFFGQLIINSAGDVDAIWPLRPDRVTVSRVDGLKVYRYTSYDNKMRIFAQDEVIHIPAFGFDGLIGQSRIALARNSIGFAISAEKFGSKFFANDARPSIAIKYPGHFDLLTDKGQKEYEAFKISWNQAYQGSDNAWKVGLLQDGMDIATIGMPPADIQFVENQKWSLNQLARVFRIPPHMIGDIEKSTSWGTGIEQQEQGYVNHTIRPWTVRIEECLNTQLLLQSDRSQLYYEHLFDALLRGDISTRFNAYVQGLTNGWMSPNEVRARENMNPIADGDGYRVPLNTSPINSNGAGQSTTADVVADNRLSWEPIVLDAMTRVIKRESNDLHGAVRRYLAKNQHDKFAAWLEQFYKSDHPDFIQAVLYPLVRAGLITSEKSAGFAVRHCNAHGNLIQQSSSNIEDVADGFSAAIPDLVSELMSG